MSKKNLTIDFIFTKKCTIKTCIFIRKRQMSFGKNCNHINDLIKDPSSTTKSQPLPKNVLYKPRLFYSKISSHSKIALNNINWYNNGKKISTSLRIGIKKKKKKKSTRAMDFIQSTSSNGLL